MINIRGRGLRDVVVLTVQATEIATSTGDGETSGARMEMIEWLLLDGIDGQRTRFTIDLAQKHAVLIPSATTNARFTFGNAAMVRTEQTLHSTILQTHIIFTLHQKTIAS